MPAYARHGDDPFLADALRGPSSDEARESLSYWRTRLDGLPRRRVSQRREAREMIVRWEERLRQAELERWGGGLVGHLAAGLAMLRGTPPATLARSIARQAAGFVPTSWLVILAASVLAAGFIAGAIVVACVNAVT